MNTIHVTMWDGSTYRGVIDLRASIYVPFFRRPDQEFSSYFYFIRTRQGAHYVYYLLEEWPFQPHFSDLHTPRSCWMKIGSMHDASYQLYSAVNFEVYSINENHHKNTIEDLEGYFPHRNYVYIGVPKKGVYRSVLQQLES